MLTRTEPKDTAPPWRVGLVGFGSYAEKGHLPAYLGSPLLS